MTTAMRIAAVLGLAAGLGACGSRQHLTATHGRAFSDVTARQTANPNGTEGKAVKGLDSQEASVITGEYRQTLGGKNGGGAQQPVLMISPQGTAAPYMPPPSAGANGR
jgi:hypothetical protein